MERREPGHKERYLEINDITRFQRQVGRHGYTIISNQQLIMRCDDWIFFELQAETVTQSARGDSVRSLARAFSMAECTDDSADAGLYVCASRFDALP